MREGKIVDYNDHVMEGVKYEFCQYCNKHFPASHFTDIMCTKQIVNLFDNILDRLSDIEIKLGIENSKSMKK